LTNFISSQIDQKIMFYLGGII